MKTPKHAPDQPSPLEPIGTMSLEIRPYAPGLLLMTIPVGLVLTEVHAVKLLAQTHNALDQLRELTAQAAGPQQKNGRAAGRGIAGRKRKR